jgi:geranylgeranyl diphosphate synthase type I
MGIAPTELASDESYPLGAFSSIAPTIEGRIARLIGAQRRRWTGARPELAVLFDDLEAAVLAPGKRLRPLLCWAAFLGAGGNRRDTQVLDVCAALELLHGFAIVHDDVMDGADRRRGRTSLHRLLACRHRSEGWNGDAERFGTGTAVLIGDLAFLLADVLMTAQPTGVRLLWNELRLELTMGQYVDLDSAARSDHDPDRARWVAAYKSGRYTVERPLHLGATVAGASGRLVRGYRRYGAPLGEAFQLRDDVLGVFGDPAVTGKPVGADLREGKPTLLFAVATRRAGPAAQQTLARAGRPDMTEADVERVRQVMVDCGALAVVEQAITDRTEEAIGVLDTLPIEPSVAAALRSVARLAAWRDR